MESLRQRKYEYYTQLELVQIEINAADHTRRMHTRGVRMDYGGVLAGNRRSAADAADNCNVHEMVAAIHDKLRLVNDEIREKEKELSDLDYELGPQSPADFERYAKSIAALSSIRKFQKLYNDDDALKKSRNALKATKVFNPLYLATNPHKIARDSLIDSLENFGVPEFKDGNFLFNLKNEIDTAVQFANQPYDWESIEDSNLYAKRLCDRRRRQRKMAIVAG